MWQLVWLDSALNDIKRLKKFIVNKNPKAAKQAAEAIKNAAERLIKNPEIGKPIKNLTPYRDLLVHFGAAGYVIRYKLYLEIIYIVYVRHYRESDFKVFQGLN